MPVKTKIMTHLKVNQTTSSETCWMCWSLNWNLRIAYHLASRAHRYWFREVQSTPEQLHREKQGKFSDFAARYWHNDVPLLETGAIGFCGSAGICGLLGTPWPDHHLPPEKPYGVGSQRTLAEYEGGGSRRHWFSNGILYIFPRKRASRVTYMSRGTYREVCCVFNFQTLHQMHFYLKWDKWMFITFLVTEKHLSKKLEKHSCL